LGFRSMTNPQELFLTSASTVLHRSNGYSNNFDTPSPAEHKHTVCAKEKAAPLFKICSNNNNNNLLNNLFSPVNKSSFYSLLVIARDCIIYISGPRNSMLRKNSESGFRFVIAKDGGGKIHATMQSKKKSNTNSRLASIIKKGLKEIQKMCPHSGIRPRPRRQTMRTAPYGGAGGFSPGFF